VPFYIQNDNYYAPKSYYPKTNLTAVVFRAGEKNAPFISIMSIQNKTYETKDLLIESLFSFVGY